MRSWGDGERGLAIASKNIMRAQTHSPTESLTATFLSALLLFDTHSRIVSFTELTWSCFSSSSSSSCLSSQFTRLSLRVGTDGLTDGPLFKAVITAASLPPSVTANDDSDDLFPPSPALL